MASIVDIPEVNPDWCGLRCVVSKGFIRANRITIWITEVYLPAKSRKKAKMKRLCYHLAVSPVCNKTHTS